MVLPKDLTKEELILQEKFSILRKKKKLLQKAKEKLEGVVHSKPIASKPVTTASSHVHAAKREAETPLQNPEDAKEKAKKMIKSGALIIKKEPTHREFKRSKSTKQKDPLFSPLAVLSKPDQENSPPKHYMTEPNDNFSGYHDESRRGNTIFVQGCGLTENILQKEFLKFGKVQNAKMERMKNQGFVTFDSCEAAENAIQEMNGSMVCKVHIKVSLARRQPHLEDVQPNAKSTPWANVDNRRNSNSQSHSEHRNLVSYDEPF